MNINGILGRAMLIPLLALAPCLSNTQGVIYKNLAWKASDTKTGGKVDGEIILNLCWDATAFNGLSIPGGKSAADWKALVQSHIYAYWNGYAGIRLNFQTTNCDVIIGHGDRKLKDDGVSFWAPWANPGSSGKAEVSQNKPSVTFCWTYQNYNSQLIQTSTHSTASNTTTYTYNAGYHNVALLAQATHEIGHVLGLAHEQNHSGKPIGCEVKMDNGTFEPLGEYDESSIMNYCNANYARRQSTPSCGDIAAIRTMYGMHPREKKDPECINECASGLEDNLAKTGADLVACKVPVNRILGTMTDYAIRPMLFETPPTPVEPRPQGQPGTEVPRIKGSAVSNSNNTWTVTFEVSNPATVRFPNSNKVEAVSYSDPSKSGLTDAYRQDDIRYQFLLPKTVTIPKGTGTANMPSGLHYSVTQTLPKKVIYTTTEYVILEFRYGWLYPDNDWWVIPDRARLDLVPKPASIDYFNAMTANTPVPVKAMAFVPSKTENGTMTIAPFRMDKYEVTQRDYMAIMKEFPFKWPGDVTAPAEGMSMYDAILYCNKRSVLEGLSPVYTFASISYAMGSCTRMTGLVADKKQSGYRLPTRKEWFHAFRAGTTTDFYWGDLGSSNPLPYGWSLENSGGKPHPVGTKLPNQWGLFDMYGNIKEWTMDSDIGFPDEPFYFQCAQGSDYSMESKYASGIPTGSYDYNTCGDAGTKWPFIGFRPIRNAVFMTPILNLLLN